MKVDLGQDLVDEQYLYIAIYIDKQYMNNTLVTINEFNKSRLSDTKIDRKSYK